MAGYSPLKITGMTTGLVQNREEFLLPDDAYPSLVNAYVWRERILRKKGYQLLGRLQRNLMGVPIGSRAAGGATTYTINILSLLGVLTTQPNASIVPGSADFPITIIINAPTNQTLTDNTGNGVLTISPADPLLYTAATINYATGDLRLTTGGAIGASPSTFTGSYYPNLPVMGICLEEIIGPATNTTVFFDQIYAYIYNNTDQRFQEFIPGTTWNASGNPVTSTDFFSEANYWVSGTTTNTGGFSTSNNKLMWVTNGTGYQGILSDPIRVTDGTTWINFEGPTYGQIDATTWLWQALLITPFRGRLLMFNTWEGPTRAGALNYSNRIRWSTIGNPFITYSAGPPAAGSWRDDIRGQGGFLDVPTDEDIISVGFVRDNLVIYCERSTWQLRYTGRSIAPFQIEKVNSELGTRSPYSSVQFDTSLVSIGDRGIIECDSYKAERIDVKIPDYVFNINSVGKESYRINGIRDFENRLAFWIINPDNNSTVFPTQRLVYNYENDSWAIFTDSLTRVGLFQEQSSRTWLNTRVSWRRCRFAWTDQPESVQVVVGGNQQGFIEQLDELTSNDPSLYIQSISTAVTTTITSPNHNLSSGDVIGISGIPNGTPGSGMNDGIFGVYVTSPDTFEIGTYNAETQQFSDNYIYSPAGTYIGGGLIDVRENFSIKSKKFNFLDVGQNIQLGFIDILMNASNEDNSGNISINVYIDYDDSVVSNTAPQNDINDNSLQPTPDTFFNSVISLSKGQQSGVGGTKFWHRVFCPSQGSFLTIEYTFSNAQLADENQESDVQIDAQVMWIRKAGKMTPI